MFGTLLTKLRLATRGAALLCRQPTVGYHEALPYLLSPPPPPDPAWDGTLQEEADTFLPYEVRLTCQLATSLCLA